MKRRHVLLLAGAIAVATVKPSALLAEEFHLLTGVDVRHWPGQVRNMPPPNGSGEFRDGDRLAGTADTGEVVQFVGTGTPYFDPNEFGALSFIFKRASVLGSLPLMGIDFLGGPLLDLDGDLYNAYRKLIPQDGTPPAEIPGSASLIDLTIDTPAGTIAINRIDATGTSEGGPAVPGDVAVTTNVIAGTTTNGVPGAAINPDVDTRTGALTACTGSSGDLRGVWAVSSLGFEIWQDTLLASSTTADVLGTFQYLGTFSGWLVERDPQTGEFPTLAGEGLGSTLWPLVNTSVIGQTYNTANGLAGGTATIGSGPADDPFTGPGEGGLALTDFGGDIGAYLDTVVIPLIDPRAKRFVYLQSAGFGINNSSDPIYYDAIGHDVVLIAAEAILADGDYDRDGDADLFDYASFQTCFDGDGAMTLGPGCDVFDFDYDEDVDISDYVEFAAHLVGPQP